MADNEKLDRIVAQSRAYQDERAKGYREQAMALYPWVCGRCARTFTPKNLSELTVHHKDHDHDNNPSDGSNWELLCLYCHDNEHQRFEAALVGNSDGKSEEATHNPFANLRDLMDD